MTLAYRIAITLTDKQGSPCWAQREIYAPMTRRVVAISDGG